MVALVTVLLLTLCELQEGIITWQFAILLDNKKTKLANLHSQGNITEFWHEINSVNCKQSIPVPVISGYSTPIFIENAFKG